MFTGKEGMNSELVTHAAALKTSKGSQAESETVQNSFVMVQATSLIENTQDSSLSVPSMRKKLV